MAIIAVPSMLELAQYEASSYCSDSANIFDEKFNNAVIHYCSSELHVLRV